MTARGVDIRKGVVDSRAPNPCVLAGRCLRSYLKTPSNIAGYQSRHINRPVGIHYGDFYRAFERGAILPLFLILRTMDIRQ